MPCPAGLMRAALQGEGRTGRRGRAGGWHGEGQGREHSGAGAWGLSASVALSLALQEMGRRGAWGTLPQKKGKSPPWYSRSPVSRWLRMARVPPAVSRQGQQLGWHIWGGTFRVADFGWHIRGVTARWHTWGITAGCHLPGPDPGGARRAGRAHAAHVREAAAAGAVAAGGDPQRVPALGRAR